MSLRVAILMDAERAREESTAMQRLAVGLAAEGLRTVIGHADGTDEQEAIAIEPGPIPRVCLPRRVPFWLRDGAARHACEQFEAAFGQGQIDVLVVSGIEAFDLAVRTSSMLDCPLIADVRSREEAEYVSRRPQHVSLAVAATEPLQRHLAARLDADHVECIRPCLPAAPTHDPTEGRFIVMLGPPRDHSIWTAAMDGVDDATREMPPDRQPMIAMELGESRADMQVWAHARERNLLHRIVSVEQIDHLRPLLGAAAMLIIPETGQVVRSVIAQAMQRGVVPITAQDPDMDFLEDGVSALTIQSADLRRSSAWGTLVHASMNRSDDDELGVAARTQSVDFLASRVAPRWSTLLNSMIHGDSIPLGIS